MGQAIHETVQEYYGRTLEKSDDLKTNACCTPDAVPPRLRALIANVHPEVSAKYYGCGLVAPEALEGARVLDLGSGSGRDAYVLAQMVGPKGEIVGVDMTAEQLSTAREHLGWHAAKFGYGKSNVRFIEGYIEKLGDLGLEPGSFDAVVSNCVINLSVDKPAVLKGAFELLKSGGELYFSDVYADRRVDEAIKADPVLYGECLGGALYWNDFLYMAKRAGFLDPRLVSSREIIVTDEVLRAKLGATRFFSATYRLFKLDALEPACEEYGQAVIYKGGIPGCADVFNLDDHHHIEKGRLFPVCGNTWMMLADTRFAKYFQFIGDFSRHYGIFSGCGTNIPFQSASAAAAPAAGSCC
ncbi:MAG: methyltransferase type 11 [Hyphomicrobium sp.]|nr:MAG: methyltransferase type 11 [Hyphomicrobium sp.]